MITAACKKCGESDSIWQGKEVAGHGWSAVKIEGHSDGSVTGVTDSAINDIMWDRSSCFPEQYGCGDCGTEAATLDDLVGVVEPPDPIERAQKFPLPGQEAMEI